MSETKINKKRKETGKGASLRTDKGNITISIVNNTQKARRSGGAANGKKGADTRFRDTRDPRPLIQQFFNGFGGVPETRTVESPPEMRRFTENQGIRANLREAELPSSGQFITGMQTVDTGTQTRGEPSRISFTNLPPLRQSIDTQTDDRQFIPQPSRESVTFNAALLNEENDRRERERMAAQAEFANLLAGVPQRFQTESRPFRDTYGPSGFRATAPENIQPLEDTPNETLEDVNEEPPLMVQPSAPFEEPEIEEDETQSYAAAEPVVEEQDEATKSLFEQVTGQGREVEGEVTEQEIIKTPAEMIIEGRIVEGSPLYEETVKPILLTGTSPRKENSDIRKLNKVLKGLSDKIQQNKDTNSIKQYLENERKKQVSYINSRKRNTEERIRAWNNAIAKIDEILDSI